MTRAARAREVMGIATGAPAAALDDVVRRAAGAETDEDTNAAVDPATDVGAAAVHAAAAIRTVHTGADADGVGADAAVAADAIDDMRIEEMRVAEAGAADAVTDTVMATGMVREMMPALIDVPAVETVDASFAATAADYAACANAAVAAAVADDAAALPRRRTRRRTRGWRMQQRT